MTEPEPPRATPIAFAPGIRRIVAANPGPMTYHGTNCWLIDTDDGTVVLDPGSAEPDHLDAIEREAGRIGLILLSHTHADHLTGVAELAARTGAPTAGFHRPAGGDFTPDLPLVDGQTIAGLRVLHTPGHAMDHLCFVRRGGIVFVGDHIMGWSTSVVPPPPAGDLVAYLEQLARLRDLPAKVFLSGHGPAITEPARLTRILIDHRLARESAIEALIDDTPRDLNALFPRAYPRIQRALGFAATANLLGHLDKLERDGRIVAEPYTPPVDRPPRRDTPFDMSRFDNLAWHRPRR